MKKERHSGDCHIYSALCNEDPYNGICTCGYALESLRSGDENYVPFCSQERELYHLHNLKQLEEFCQNKQVQDLLKVLR